MAKRIIYIVLGALFVFGILFLLWSWFFSSSGTQAPSYGSFCTSTQTSNTGAGSSGNSNGEVSLGSSAINNAVPLGTNTNEGGVGEGVGGVGGGVNTANSGIGS